MFKSKASRPDRDRTVKLLDQLLVASWKPLLPTAPAERFNNDEVERMVTWLRFMQEASSTPPAGMAGDDWSPFWRAIADFRTRAKQLLDKELTALVDPKLQRLLPVIMQCKGSLPTRPLWDRGCESDCYHFLVREEEVAMACENFEQLKTEYEGLDITASDAHGVLDTLGFASLGMVVEMVYAVSALQHTWTSTRKAFDQACNTDTGFDQGLYVHMRVLRHYTQRVSRLNVSGPASLQAFTATEAMEDRLGIPAVAGLKFAELAQVGVKEAGQLANEVVAHWVARLSTLSQRVKDGVPTDYEDWIVKAFDMDKAKDLVNMSWGPFAADWQTLHGAYTAVTKLCGEVGVNLNKDHATALELVEKRIKHGRVFISAVSAVTFIVNTLPTVPKAHRYDRIAAYLKKLDDTSSKKILPVNLLKYLEQDIFKCPPAHTRNIGVITFRANAMFPTGDAEVWAQTLIACHAEEVAMLLDQDLFMFYVARGLFFLLTLHQQL